MTFAAHTPLGPYVILSKLGSGGMGEVYLAKDKRLDRKVAIKVLLPAFSADPERLSRFELETKSLALLNHPNILQIYDTGLHEESPYLVMEFLEGQTLRQRMDEHAIPPRKAVEIACQITKGLAAAHEKGITHRDLKPENIFLLEGDLVKILDFGLAKYQAQPEADSDVTQKMIAVAPPVTQPGIVVGTVGYLSPEQVVGRPADPRSDIFSLGVVLWEMLRGSRPFHRDSAVETMHAILKEDPPELGDMPGLPPGLSRIIARCLDKNPRARFQSAQDLAFNLESLSLTTGTQAAVSRQIPISPRRGRLWIGLGVAAALGLGGAFWVGRSTRGDRSVQFHRITYQRGVIRSARFGPDGATYVCALSLGGAPAELRTGRIDGAGTRPLGLPAGTSILSISKSGEMALLLGAEENGAGMLAKAPMGGGAPREILDGVQDADWGPDGKDLAVVRTGSGGRHRLEYPIGRVLYEAPESTLIFCPRVSPKGDLVAFATTSGVRNGELCVVDRKGSLRSLGKGRCETLVWAPGGEELLVALRQKEDRHEIRRVDLSGRQRVVYSALGLLEIHDVSRSGRVLVEQTLVQSGIRVKTPGDKVERDLSWLHSSNLADISGDGKLAAFLELQEGEGPGGAYIRKTDGSEAVRLGEGDPLVLSPDARWVMARSFDAKPELLLLPTGAGESRRLPSQGILADWALFLRNGREILIGGAGVDKSFGVFLQEIEGGAIRRMPWEITPEAYAVICPDGDRVAFGPMEGRIDIASMKTGSVRSLPGARPQEVLIQWSLDGRYLYTADLGGLPARVFRIDVGTGQRSPWKELAPSGTSEGARVEYLSIAPDGQTYGYSFKQVLSSDLYLMDSWR